MKSTNLAIIDLGSNTFHLLIASLKDNDAICEIYRERQYVKLALEGRDKIAHQSFEIGIETLNSFYQSMQFYNVRQFAAVGTAMLRTAENSNDFVLKSLNDIQIPIQIIDGDIEAELIFQGINQIYTGREACLVMDIGGGSVEFIIAKDRRILWKSSFTVGVSYLKNHFNLSAKPSVTVNHDIYNYLDNELATLLHQMHLYRPTTFIGSAGTFEVLENAIGCRDHSNKFGTFDIKAFQQLYDSVMGADIFELERFDWLPPERRDLIHPAFLLIDWVVNKMSINESLVSHYALKEGALMDFKHGNYLTYNSL